MYIFPRFLLGVFHRKDNCSLGGFGAGLFNYAGVFVCVVKKPAKVELPGKWRSEAERCAEEALRSILAAEGTQEPEKHKRKKEQGLSVSNLGTELPIPEPLPYGTAQKH